MWLFLKHEKLIKIFNDDYWISFNQCVQLSQKSTKQAVSEYPAHTGLQYSTLSFTKETHLSLAGIETLV